MRRQPRLSNTEKPQAHAEGGASMQVVQRSTAGSPVATTCSAAVRRHGRRLSLAGPLAPSLTSGARRAERETRLDCERQGAARSDAGHQARQLARTPQQRCPQAALGRLCSVQARRSASVGRQREPRWRASKQQCTCCAGRHARAALPVCPAKAALSVWCAASLNAQITWGSVRLITVHLTAGLQCCAGACAKPPQEVHIRARAAPLQRSTAIRMCLASQNCTCTLSGDTP